MTGPARGKLTLEAKVYLCTEDKRIRLDSTVYIHLKGFARARVTHLDIEHQILDQLIPPKSGKFLSIHGIENGIDIVFGGKRIEYEGEKFKVDRIEIISPKLNKILEKGKGTRTWVGGKVGGIYIGFKKEEIKKLESLAEEVR